MITLYFSVRRAAALGFFTAALSAVDGVSAQSVSGVTRDGTNAAVAAPALSPAAEALRAALVRRFGAGSPEFAAYAERNFQPIWSGRDGDVKARALTAAMVRAGEHALPAAKYQGDALAARLPAADPELEADLTAAFLAYARDIGTGLLRPRSVDRGIHTVPARPDPAALVKSVAETDDIEAFLDALAPSDPLYRRLVAHYAAFRSMVADDIWGPRIRKGKTLRPGERHARVAEARARLTGLGDLDPAIYDDQAAGAAADGTQLAATEIATDVPRRAFDPDLFDEPMVVALRRFQERHGLNADGVIGPATLRQLNVSPNTRAEQIAVTLERMRWLNKDLGERHILVNLADFTMAVINRREVEFTSRVVVGKTRADLRTPEFSKMMTHMIVNPSWHVPRSIATKEILPKLQEDPNYLADRGMRVVGADTEIIDWTEVTAETFPGRITQRPGRRNALGTVKFMFPNRFSIYLHDTPHKRLFARDVRAYSHGCVRVEKPHEFAEYLLTGQAEKPGEYFRQLLNRGRERRVNLENPLPVHITYRTAWVDESGVQQFRGDIYGRDSRIADALAAAGVTIVE